MVLVKIKVTYISTTVRLFIFIFILYYVHFSYIVLSAVLKKVLAKAVRLHRHSQSSREMITMRKEDVTPGVFQRGPAMQTADKRTEYCMPHRPIYTFPLFGRKMPVNMKLSAHNHH